MPPISLPPPNCAPLRRKAHRRDGHADGSHGTAHGPFAKFCTQCLLLRPKIITFA